MRNGALFADPAECWVNPVNTVGVMGAGLAKRFATTYPRMFDAYRMQHGCGALEVGRVHLWRNPGFDCLPGDERVPNQPQWIANLPTKQHWRNPSTMEYVSLGVLDLARQCCWQGIVSLAIPALGCGLGGLPFDDVRALVEATFLGDDWEVRLYPPR